MLYPLSSIDKLGFTEIKELIKKHCLSIMGQQMVDKIQVMNNYDLIHKFLSQAAEFKNILVNDAALPIQHFFDIKSLANKARIEGVFLSEEEFFQVQTSLTTVFAVIAYFNEREGHAEIKSQTERTERNKGHAIWTNCQWTLKDIEKTLTEYRSL